jgi:O-acetylserine/cysteine efflux transporter
MSPSPARAGAPAVPATTPHPATHLSAPHLLLALAVMAVWGSNFVVIKYALATLPPLWLATLRFLLAAFPLVLVLPRPRVTWGNLAAYGVAIGAGQFGLLFFAMTRYISPGLASLLMQTQVFFTIGLAIFISGERPRSFQLAATLVAAGGLAIIATHTDAHTGITGILLVLGAALSWALGNTIGRAAGRVNVLAYVAWSSLFAVPPLLALSLALEGWPRIAAGMQQAGWLTWMAVLWQSVGNSMFGYGVWAWLLARYPAATVSPLALLVPVFGMGAAALILREPMPPWKLLAAALVLGGLALNLLWPRWRALIERRSR